MVSVLSSWLLLDNQYRANKKKKTVEANALFLKMKNGL